MWCVWLSCSLKHFLWFAHGRTQSAFIYFSLSASSSKFSFKGFNANNSICLKGFLVRNWLLLDRAFEKLKHALLETHKMEKWLKGGINRLLLIRSSRSFIVTYRMADANRYRNHLSYSTVVLMFHFYWDVDYLRNPTLFAIEIWRLR